MHALVLQSMLGKSGKHKCRVPNVQGESFAMAAAAAKQRAINN
jgi:hypothetical protein